MKQIDYTNALDLLILDSEIGTLSFDDKRYFATLVVDRRMYNAPLLIRWVVQWRAVREKLHPMIVWLRIFEERPQFLEKFIEKFRWHMLYGKDLYSSDAAGGYCGIELATIVQAVEHLQQKSAEKLAEEISLQTAQNNS